MRKLLSLLSLSTVLLFTLNSCEDENLITGASGSTGTNNPSTGTNTGTTTTKCYVKEVVEVEDGKTYKNKFTYNTKNLLTDLDQDGVLSTYEYDSNNRVTKLTVVDDAAVEIYTYSYDAKGVMNNIKYSSKNTAITLSANEYKLTTNASGQVTQVTVVSEDAENNFDMLFEYDKNNIKKVIFAANGQKMTLLENLTFDTKTSVYANTGMAKINIPYIVIGLYFGENLTYLMNANNILTDKTISIFAGEITTTYKYEYTKDNLPSKMTYLQIDGTDKYEGSATYSYECK